MTRRARAAAPLAVCAAFAAGVVGGGAPSAGAATAAPQEACPTADGVTVIVDFQELGGQELVRCAPGSSASGLDALSRAGIAYQTTIRFPGFVCRIAGAPSSDPCIDTAPANAHWSYWVAQRGGSWCLSNHGAGARVPRPGTVEGWSFSLNRTQATAPPPRYAVPAAVPGAAPLDAGDCSAATPTPIATTSPTTTPSATSTPSAPSKPTPNAPAPAAAAAAPTGAGDAPASGGARPIDGGSAGTGATPDAAASPAEAQGPAEFTGPTGELDGTPAEASSDAVPRPDAFDATGGANSGDDGPRDVALASGGGADDGGSPLGVIAAGSLIGAGSLVAAVMRKRERAN